MSTDSYYLYVEFTFVKNNMYKRIRSRTMPTVHYRSHDELNNMVVELLLFPGHCLVILLLTMMSIQNSFCDSSYTAQIWKKSLEIFEKNSIFLCCLENNSKKRPWAKIQMNQIISKIFQSAQTDDQHVRNLLKITKTL